MDILTAYQRTMDTIRELQDRGILTEIKPSVSTSTRNDRLPREKWVNVSFYPIDPEQRETIRKAADTLGWQGIAFDTGGCCGKRDWEIDWSFRLTETPDGEIENRRGMAEDMVRAMEAMPDPNRIHPENYVSE